MNNLWEKFFKKEEKASNELNYLREENIKLNLQISKLQEELKETNLLVQIDSLTASLNRRGLKDALIREVSRHERQKTDLSVALIDIDNFKKINDTFGHFIGDKVLIHTVNSVRECLRPDDIIARYGGEEFLILMPNTSEKDGIEVIKRVQNRLVINQVHINDDQETIKITFSGGVAQLLEGEDTNTWINRADYAMYQAKHTGKNCVKGSE